MWCRGEKTTKEAERETNKSVLGVCRIRKLHQRGGNVINQTIGSGCVIKSLKNHWPWKDNCCVVTNDKVIPKEDFDINKFQLEFLKSESIRTYELSRFANSEDVRWSTSGLVVIPLQDPTKLGKSPGIFRYRPFFRGTGRSKTLFCQIVDDMDVKSFAVKSFTVTPTGRQYVLKDGQSSFKTFAELVGASNRKPHGAVILSRFGQNLDAVGVLNSGSETGGIISPVWLSNENLSSLSKYFSYKLFTDDQIVY